MSDIGIRVSRATLDLFRGSQGLPGTIAALSTASGVTAQPFRAEQAHLANIAPELAEKASVARYPLVALYCSRVTNQLKEKFRLFSGTVQMVAEARVSQSTIDGIEQASHFLADAVTEVLDASRGDWGNGMYYTGGYEITYGPVKQGGKNFLQITKVSFNLEVSSD
jgi:hypothetical protein